MTNTILAATLIASVICFMDQTWMDRFIFNPAKIHQRKEWYRFITSGFIHANWIHLLVNMFVLYTFGSQVESYYHELFGSSGRSYYLLLYFGALLVSLLPTYRKQKENPGYNALGASGAVSAVVFAYILINPLTKLCLYGLLCLPGFIFGILYLVYCVYAARKGEDYINHDAHLWGGLYGILFTLAMKPDLAIYFLDQIRSY